MAATTPSAALVPAAPVFTGTERLALAGFLAGYSGLTRQAYELDLRQYASWCQQHHLRLFGARVLLDVSTTAAAENTIKFGLWPGDAARRDPPPSWCLRRADVETGDHDNAGLRVQLAAVLQGYRRLPKLGDAEEFLI